MDLAGAAAAGEVESVSRSKMATAGSAPDRNPEEASVLRDPILQESVVARCPSVSPFERTVISEGSSWQAR